ncbi:unnamed protein product [Phaedon cochleariae]|uniref:Uncharacterized protein n=1 Tax=Phaedon cochleariae TaxID=80249 RepID=A0A9N9S7A0_PHACE|nr:unnamed protein product [Phaedon cochleariae]
MGVAAEDMVQPNDEIDLDKVPAMVVSYLQISIGIYPFNQHLFEELDLAGAEVANRPYQGVGKNTEEEPDIDFPTVQPGISLSQQESPDVDDPIAQPGTSLSQQELPDTDDSTAQPGTSLSQQELLDTDDPTAQPGTSSSQQESTSNALF